MAKPQPIQIFTKFSQLPREIRFMIWKAALPGPRVITVRQAPLKYTIEEWNGMNERERASASGKPANTESLYARMRDGVGPDQLWRLPEGLPVECVQVLEESSRDTPHLSLRDEVRFPESFTRMHIIFQGSFPNSLGDAIFFHLTQGVPIDSIRSFLGLSTEREVRLLIFMHCRGFNPYLSTYKEAIDCPDLVWTRSLLGIRSDRFTIQTLYACHESRQVALTSYSKVFSTTASHSETYFDFKRDTLFLQGAKFAHEIKYDDMARGIPKSISCISDTANLKKVQNIAILLDSFGASRTPPSGFCEWLALLFRSFSGIKRVTLVFGCLEQGAWGTFRNSTTCYSPDTHDNPCIFIDPEAVEAVREATGSDDRTVRLENFMQGFRQAQKRFSGQIDVEKLESHRLNSSESDVVEWSVPTFEYKVALTRSICECDEDLVALENIWETFMIKNSGY